MVARSRHTLLAALGTAATGVLAGCASPFSDEPPAGSLRFVNDHELPHVLGMRVVDVGSSPRPPPELVTGPTTVSAVQREPSTARSLDPDEHDTYRGVFSEPVWYAVPVTVDGRPPRNAERTAFHPVPPDREDANYLPVQVHDSGEGLWVISETDDSGAFER